MLFSSAYSFASTSEDSPVNGAHNDAYQGNEINNPVDYEWICSACRNYNKTERCTKCGKVSKVPEVSVLSKTKQIFKISIKNPKDENISKYFQVRTSGSAGKYYVEASKDNGLLDRNNILETMLPPGAEFKMTINGVDEKDKPCTDKLVIDVKMDSLLRYNITTLTGAKQKTKYAYESGKSSYTFALYGETSRTSLKQTLQNHINSGKWENYNKFFGKIYTVSSINKGRLYPEQYKYKGKVFTIYTVQFKYKLSAAKDKKLRTRLEKNIASLKLKKNTTKTKIKKITKYIEKNRRYKRVDANNLYTMVFSKHGDCQHYSWEFAVMCSLAGVKAECVSGYTDKNQVHFWNQVKVGKKWYNYDMTWVDTRGDYSKWCFRGTRDSNFNKKHKLEPQYKTNAWKKDHPLSRTSLKW